MEQIITSIVNLTVVPLTNLIGWLVSSGAALVLFGVIWVAFGAAIVWSQGSLDAAWAWLKEQHIVVQGLIWLLFLPATAGLWIWETGWPFLVRFVLVGGLAFWSILIFIPRATPKG
jgi:hypothetical protein